MTIYSFLKIWNLELFWGNFGIGTLQFFDKLIFLDSYCNILYFWLFIESKNIKYFRKVLSDFVFWSLHINISWTVVTGEYFFYPPLLFPFFALINFHQAFDLSMIIGYYVTLTMIWNLILLQLCIFHFLSIHKITSFYTRFYFLEFLSIIHLFMITYTLKVLSSIVVYANPPIWL